MQGSNSTILTPPTTPGNATVATSHMTKHLGRRLLHSAAVVTPDHTIEVDSHVNGDTNVQPDILRMDPDVFAALIRRWAQAAPLEPNPGHSITSPKKRNAPKPKNRRTIESNKQWKERMLQSMSGEEEIATDMDAQSNTPIPTSEEEAPIPHMDFPPSASFIASYKIPATTSGNQPYWQSLFPKLPAEVPHTPLEYPVDEM